jgi:hypothetical protein
MNRALSDLSAGGRMGHKRELNNNFFYHQNEKNNGREQQFDCRAQSGNHYRANCTKQKGSI